MHSSNSVSFERIEQNEMSTAESLVEHVIKENKKFICLDPLEKRLLEFSVATFLHRACVKGELTLSNSD